MAERVIPVNKGNPQITVPTNDRRAKRDLQDFIDCMQKRAFNSEETFQTLHDYCKEHRRILYSVLSTTIYDLLDEKDDGEKFGIFRTNLETFIDYISHNTNLEAHITQYGPEDTKLTCYTAWKIWDHLLLAEKQYSEIRNPMSEYNENMQAELEKFQAKLTKETSGQLIALVGIFTALSFVLFGGISLFDNLIQNISTASLSRLMTVGCIWGLEMLNVIFVFLFCVGKMTGQDFKSNKDPSATFFQKYPVVVWTDYILITVLGISVWIAFWLENTIIQPEEWNQIIAYAGAAIITLVTVIIGVKIISKKTRYKPEKQSVDENGEDAPAKK